MKLGKPWKITIGVFTALVALYPFLIALFMFPFFLFAATLEGRNPDLPVGFLSFFFLFFGFAMLTVFLQMGLSIFYLIQVIKSKNVSDILRIVLGLGIFYMPFLAMPISFFVFVWPESAPEWALEKSGEAKN